MKLLEIVDGADVAALLERASVEVEQDIARLERAESALTAALEEKNRITRILAKTQHELALANDMASGAKQAWLRSTIDAGGETDIISFEMYHDHRKDQKRLVDQLAFVGSWSLEDAARGVLTAQIERDDSESSALETRACEVRLKLIAAVGPAMALDPGAKATLDDSWSQKALQKSVSLAESAMQLRAALTAHDERVASQRELISPRLFNS